MAQALTTELEAVNTMLSAIGESPVSSLSNDARNVDVIIAQRILNEVLKEVQALGWNFNTEVGVSLPTTSDNTIPIPTNAARVNVATGDAGGVAYTQRGEFLYDLTNHTYTIPTPPKVILIIMLDWVYLPEFARNYIMIRAARRFQDRVVGSEKHHTFNQQDEFVALTLMREAEASGGQYNIFDNYDVSRALDRGAPLYRTS